MKGSLIAKWSMVIALVASLGCGRPAKANELPPGADDLIKHILPQGASKVFFYGYLAWRGSNYIYHKLFQLAVAEDKERIKKALDKLNGFVNTQPCADRFLFDGLRFNRDFRSVMEQIDESLEGSITGSGGLWILVARLQFISNHIRQYCVPAEASLRLPIEKARDEYTPFFCSEPRFGNTDYLALQWCRDNYLKYQVRKDLKEMWRSIRHVDCGNPHNKAEAPVQAGH